MLNVFDIFKMLIGIVIFVVLITLFLRFAGGYTDISQTGREYDTINAFDALLRSTYTSGNPGEFQGFGKIEVTFAPPLEPRHADSARIMFPSGQKMLSVPAFVMTGEGKMTASRTCDDYGWFSFCYVISMPAGDTVLFSPVAGSTQERDIIRGVVESLPSGVTLAYCDGDDFLVPSGEPENNRKDFLALVNANKKVEKPCSAEVTEGYWLVSFTSEEDAERTAVVDAAGWTVTDSSGNSKNTIIEYSDVTIALCGPGSLENKRAMLERQLSVAASVMHDRTILVRDGMVRLNVEPCRGCSTAYPKACGYTEYGGDGSGARRPSTKLYPEFITALSALESEIAREEHSHRSVVDMLGDTTAKYNELKEGGCE